MALTGRVEGLLLRLRVVASLEGGDRLMTEAHGLSVAPRGVWGALWRLVLGEDRARNIDSLDALVMDALGMCDLLVSDLHGSTLHGSARRGDASKNAEKERNESKKSWDSGAWMARVSRSEHTRCLAALVDALRRSLDGITALAATYGDDIVSGERLHLLQERVRGRLRYVEELLEDA